MCGLDRGVPPRRPPLVPEGPVSRVPGLTKKRFQWVPPFHYCPTSVVVDVVLPRTQDYVGYG